MMNHRLPIHRLILFTFGLMLVGCGPQRAWTTSDPWFHAPPSSVGLDGPTLPTTRVDLVQDSKELAAEELLEKSAAVPITPQQAAEFVGLPLRPNPGARPYLVRSVYLIRGTGVYEVYPLRDKSIVVLHESLGDHAVHMKRQALVLQLDDPPTQVFVVCRMTQ